MREFVQRDLTSLNIDQRKAFDALCGTITSGADEVFFLQGFGGIGKIFLINLILTKIRIDDDIALSTISSEIVVTLLEEDTTTHSHFKIPIDIHMDSTCNILVQSHLIEFLYEIQLIFWDEMSIQHRYTFEVVNCIMKNIHKNLRSFEGVIFCFCEDFRQILPVIPRDTHGQNCINMHQMFFSLRACSISLSQHQYTSPFSNNVFKWTSMTRKIY